MDLKVAGRGREAGTLQCQPMGGPRGAGTLGTCAIGPVLSWSPVVTLVGVVEEALPAERSVAEINRGGWCRWL